MNVNLVKNLRESVKIKVLPQLTEISKKNLQGGVDSMAGSKGKSIIQKVSVLLLNSREGRKSGIDI